jgi:hypothetical protein
MAALRGPHVGPSECDLPPTMWDTAISMTTNIVKCVDPPKILQKLLRKYRVPTLYNPALP